MNLLQSTMASAERVFELLDEPEETPDPATADRRSITSPATSPSKDVSFRYEPETPLIEDLNLDVRSGDTWPSSARPAPARRPSSTC
jgi:ATP-binding cassette subfamily B multidrug efflux pump